MKKNLKSNNVNVENNVVYDRSKQDEEISVKGYEHIESQMFTTDYAIIHSKFWKQNNDIFKFIKDNSHLIQNFSKNDYSVGLFLLLLYKNGLINIESENDNNSGNIKDRLTHFFTLVNNTNEHFDETLKQYKPVLNFFEPIVDRLSTEFIEGLLKFFKQINADIMDAYFIEFFEDTIKSFSDKMEVEYFNVPFDLVRFVYSLAEIKPGAKIYEPNSGNASFGIFLNDSVEYIGMVNAEITWVLGVLHRITYNSKNKINYEFSSSNNNWQEDKFDLIILHNNEYFDCNAKIINNALNSLIENGKIVLITNDNDNRHLKELVNNDFIEMVIELPRELGTDNLIVISKNKVQEKSKRIFFVEFKDYWMNPYFIFYSEKILNTIEIETVGDNIFNSNFIDYFKQIKEFRENSNRTMVDRANGKREKVKLFYKINQKIVNLLEVIDNGYSLKVERYFLEKIEGAVRLGDILEPVGKIINFNADNESIDIEFEDYFSNDDLPKSGHLIEVDTLKENADSLKIIPSELQNTIRYLDKDCILIPRFKFDNLEFYDFSWLRDEEMGNFPRVSSSIADVTSKLFTKGEFVTNDILSYKIKDLTNVAPEFLAFEIQNSYIQKQFNIFKYGKIPFLSNDDFKRIEIKLPSFEDQVDWLNSGGYRIKWLEQKINELEQQIKVKENAKITIKQAVKSTNHKIARPIQNIQSALNNIKFKLRDINVDFDLKIHNDYNRTIKSSFESIAHNFSFFKSSLNELSNLETADVARLKEVNFRNFIENYEKSIKNSLNGNENYNLKFIQNIENFDNYNYIVKMDDTMLSILLNLFLDNAEKHGFIDKTKVYNLEYKFTSIKKNIFQNNEYGQYIEKHIRIIIEISNDGVPFPYNYTLNDFCRLNSCAGNTRGTGTGGFLINEYIKNHNKGQSTLELNTNYLNSKITKFTFSIPVERVVKIINPSCN